MAECYLDKTFCKGYEHSKRCLECKHKLHGDDVQKSIMYKLPVSLIQPENGVCPFEQTRKK